MPSRRPDAPLRVDLSDRSPHAGLARLRHTVGANDLVQTTDTMASGVIAPARCEAADEAPRIRHVSRPGGFP